MGGTRKYRLDRDQEFHGIRPAKHVLLDHGVLVGDNNNDFYQGCCLPLPNLDGAEGGEPSPTPNITVEVIANLSPEQEARFGARHLELK